MAVTKTTNRVIEGDNIDEQIAALPELTYLTRVNPNNPAIWETYNPKTGEIVDTGVFEGGGDQGLLNASRPVLALTASVLGAPYLSDLIAGSTGLTGSALSGATGATIAGGSTALTGGNAEDTLKAALLGGGGAYLGNEIQNALYDSTAAADTAAGLNPKYGTTYDEIIANLMDSPEAQKALQDIVLGNTSAPIADTTTADTVLATGARPTTVNVGDVFATIPKLEVTGNKDKSLDLNQVINMINAGNLDTTNTVTNVADTVNTNKKTDLSASDMIRLAGVGATVAALNANQGGGDGTTTFPIVPVPEEWTSPVRTKEQNAALVSQYPKLNSIDFGDKNLLIGTQWEKFLSPTYGQVPTPVQYSQPSNLSYSDLMGILGSKQGMPSANSLSINDIISGIQNQYGQTAKS